MAVYSVVLTNLHHVYKYQAEGFALGGGVIAFIQIHMANKTNEVRKFCLDFDLRRFDTILIDPEGNISKSRSHIYIYIQVGKIANFPCVYFLWYFCDFSMVFD